MGKRCSQIKRPSRHGAARVKTVGSPSRYGYQRRAEASQGGGTITCRQSLSGLERWRRRTPSRPIRSLRHRSVSPRRRGHSTRCSLLWPCQRWAVARMRLLDPAVGGCSKGRSSHAVLRVRAHPAIGVVTAAGALLPPLEESPHTETDPSACSAAKASCVDTSLATLFTSPVTLPGALPARPHDATLHRRFRGHCTWSPSENEDLTVRFPARRTNPTLFALHEPKVAALVGRGKTISATSCARPVAVK